MWVKPGLQPMSALRPLIGPKQPKMVRVEAFRLSTVSTGIAARVDRNGSPYSASFGQKDPPLPLRKLPLNPAAARVVSPELPRKLARTASQRFTSVRAIDAQLNETPRGGAWHPTSAARLLSRLQGAN
jgi:hypothetical protein